MTEIPTSSSDSLCPSGAFGVDRVLAQFAAELWQRLGARDDRGHCRSLRREPSIEVPAVKADVEDEAAQARPASSWRPVDLVGDPDQGTVEAVRKVVPDWDGRNWSAVRTVLRSLGRTDEQIDRMTEMDVRMEFAINQTRMVVELGGRPNTTDNTIVRMDFAASLPPAADRLAFAHLHMATPGGRAPLTPTEQSVWDLLPPRGQERSAAWLAHHDRADTSAEYIRKCVGAMRRKGWPVGGGTGGVGYWREAD